MVARAVDGAWLGLAMSTALESVPCLRRSGVLITMNVSCFSTNSHRVGNSLAITRHGGSLVAARVESFIRSNNCSSSASVGLFDAASNACCLIGGHLFGFGFGNLCFLVHSPFAPELRPLARIAFDPLLGFVIGPFALILTSELGEILPEGG